MQIYNIQKTDRDKPYNTKNDKHIIKYITKNIENVRSEIFTNFIFNFEFYRIWVQNTRNLKKDIK